MQFLFPGFLLAGLAIAIPILIHLFYFRRFKPVYFTNVRFLREIREETASRSRLRNLLVLLFRILAILFLVAAFAQPFLPRGEAAGRGPKAVGIYIDNSFSMGALSQDVPLLELARAKAREIVQGYGTEDRFQIMTNAYGGREQRLVSLDQALEMIGEVSLGPEVTEMATVLERQKQVLGTAPQHNLVSYLISDFQRTTALTGPLRDSVLQVKAIPLQAVQEMNVSLDSAWFEGPVLLSRQTNPLVVSVTNHGTEAVGQVRLSLLESGQERPVGLLDIPAGQTVTDTIPVTPRDTGWQSLEVRITDYPVQFDDVYYLAGQVRDRLSILTIHPGTPEPFLEKGLREIRAFRSEFQGSDAVDYSRLADHQLVILEDLPALSSGLRAALTGYMASGGNLLVFPPAGRADAPGYNEFLSASGARILGSWDARSREAASLNTRSFVFRDVYTNAREHLKLPAVQGGYRLSSAQPVNEEVLIPARDGSPLVARYPGQAGNLFLSVAPLDPEVNELLRTGEVFIPMVYKMALSGQRELPLAHVIGRDRELEFPVPVRGSAEQLLRLRSGDLEVVPGQRFVGSRALLSLGSTRVTAGIYEVTDDVTGPVGRIAFNDDRRESDLSMVSKDEIRAWGVDVPDDVARADLSAWVGEQERGVVLWRWCVILALCCIAVESLLLRFWKT